MTLYIVMFNDYEFHCEGSPGDTVDLLLEGVYSSLDLAKDAIQKSWEGDDHQFYESSDGVVYFTESENEVPFYTIRPLELDKPMK